MKNNYIKFILILILFVGVSRTDILAQESDKEQQLIEDLIEEIATAAEDEELDYTTLFDDLYHFYQDPINLNETTTEELEKLPFLNRIQIFNLLAYRDNSGRFLSVYELQLINGWDEVTIRRILPFVTVRQVGEKMPYSLKKAIKYGRHQLFLRSQWITEQQKGYRGISDSALAKKPNSRYLGNKYKFYTRYKFQYKKHLMWGFTAEKDPGEEFFSGEQKNGFDFYSAHLQINDLGPLKKLIVGDYQVQFGQGLTFFSGMTTGKSSYVLNVKKKAQGLRKYSSVDENKFMRGVGSTVQLGNFDISAFYSKKKIDANIAEFDTLDNEIREVTSFQTTGYHRTPNEMADKDAIDETVYGAHLGFHQEKYKIGLTITNYQFGSELKKELKPYNQFDFQGDQNTNIGLDYQFTLKHINFFGEAAMSENGGKAIINGALVPLSPQVSLAALHRHYQRDFQAYYSGAFAESSRAQNENGIYIGTEILPYKGWKVSAYFDHYTFPWLRYRLNAPVHGQDYFVQVDYNPSRNVSMYVKYKNENKPENSGTEESDLTRKLIKKLNKSNFRFHISYKITSELTLKNRFEYARYKKEGKNTEEGYMIYQDIGYKPEKLPLTLNFRYAIFNTDSYNPRIYAYENDILYGFSIPAYYYRGTRTYLTLKYTIADGIDMWLRYARTHFSNVETISSSLAEIDGKNKSEVKIQFRFKF